MYLKELPSKLQDLFIITENIAIPNAYFEEIKSWSESNFRKKQIIFF